MSARKASKKGRPSARRARARPRARRPRPWTRWPNERLLDMRICDLGLSIEGSWLVGCIEELNADLSRREIRFRPHFWLSHDWFSPENVPGIAIPFYLAHPRLMRLERSQMLEVEGGAHDECIKILRHECGHAVQHAYRLQRRRRWQQLFGRSSERYPEYYRPNPASRRYVQHLRLYYAQSHPDEDFAETFAVWLQRRDVWRRRYAGWPAMRKLEFVEEVVEKIKEEAPSVRTRMRVDPVRRIRMTLREYYAKKRDHYTLSYPSTYDRDLRRLFSDNPKHKHRERASRFLRRNRTEIRRLVSRWTGAYQFTLDQVLTDMIGRCRELKLRTVGSERKLRMNFAVLLTVKTMHFLYSRHNWIAL